MDEDKITDAGEAGEEPPLDAGKTPAGSREPVLDAGSEEGSETPAVTTEDDEETADASEAEAVPTPDSAGAVEVDSEAETAQPETAGDEGEEAAEPDAEAAPHLGDATFAHAPTAHPGRTGGDEADEDPEAAGLEVGADEPADEDPEDDFLTTGFDRRRDFVWWLLTPVVVMVVGPLLAGTVAFLVAEADTGYPAICRAAAPDNRCEEVILRMAAQHTAAFLIGWLLIWAMPWWRALRPFRIVFAVFVVLVLVAAPLRLLSSLDYQTVMGR